MPQPAKSRPETRRQRNGDCRSTQRHFGRRSTTARCDRPTTGRRTMRPSRPEQRQDRPARAPAQHDHWYFSAGEASQMPDRMPPVPSRRMLGGKSRKDAVRAASPPKLPSARSTARRRPLRFVWRTDAEGRFSAISPEFAERVGSARGRCGRPALQGCRGHLRARSVGRDRRPARPTRYLVRPLGAVAGRRHRI